MSVSTSEGDCPFCNFEVKTEKFYEDDQVLVVEDLDYKGYDYRLLGVWKEHVPCRGLSYDERLKLLISTHRKAMVMRGRLGAGYDWCFWKHTYTGHEHYQANFSRVWDHGIHASGYREFFIAGFPRSGTTYMSFLMQAFGFEVGHEQMGLDGKCAWTFVPLGGCQSWGVQAGTIRENYRFGRLIHLVRDPLKTVSSNLMEGYYGLTDGYARKFLDVPKGYGRVARVLCELIGWSKLIQAQEPDLVLRVEDVPEALEVALLSWGFPVLSRGVPSKTVNSRVHPYFRDLDDMVSQGDVPRELVEGYEEWCEMYGYVVQTGQPLS